MKIKEDIRPISYVKAHAADMLEQVNKTRRPVFVTQNGEAKAVLLDSESYENMKNAIGLLKAISQGENDIKNGRMIDQNEVFTRIENKLKVALTELENYNEKLNYLSYMDELTGLYNRRGFYNRSYALDVI